MSTSNPCIDPHGFRANIGIILHDGHERILWAKRCDAKDAWQLPQGGIQADESLEQALARELFEELGLSLQDVQVLGSTADWLSYTLPQPIKKGGHTIVGQKQRWFALTLSPGKATQISLNRSDSPEFTAWRWSSYWYPLHAIVNFKREVYRAALTQLAPLVFHHATITEIGDA